jgi:hypothetical protein
MDTKNSPEKESPTPVEGNKLAQGPQGSDDENTPPPPTATDSDSLPAWAGGQLFYYRLVSIKINAQ